MNFFDKLFRKANLVHEPVPYKYDDVMVAWDKIYSILKNARNFRDVMIAENMFNNMLHQFGFSDEQRNSPLIHGMQTKINSIRAQHEEVREGGFHDPRLHTRCTLVLDTGYQGVL
jgi:hypothetical protein